MTKTVFIFVILILFVVITIWFVIQKTKEVNKTTEIPTTTTSPTPTSQAGEPIRYDNGLAVQDIVVGTGKTAENGDTLNAKYIGKLSNGTVFDSSDAHGGQPFTFQIGSGQVIKGWDLGLLGMKEGGKRKLTIPPELGYGERGAGGVIPPNATLLFEIELVSVTKK